MQTKQHEEITIDPVKLVAVRGGQVLNLALTELRILSLFVHNKGKVLDKPTIHASMQNATDGKHSNLVDVYINYLRQKIGKNMITTVRGKGYCFGNQEVAA